MRMRQLERLQLGRRKVLLSLASIPVGCGCLSAHAQSASNLRGCFAQPVFQQVDSIRRNPIPNTEATIREMLGSITETSGQSAEFDRELGILLTDMSSYFEFSPKVGFFEDPIPNAFAVPNSLHRRFDGSIGLGRNLINQHLSLERGGESVVAVCAHEFAHIFQLFTPYFDGIKNSELSSVGVELHADYLAGSYLARLVSRRTYFQLYRVGQAWSTMRTVGFGGEITHGRVAQRLAAIEQGYYDSEQEAGFTDVANAAARGLNFIRSI